MATKLIITPQTTSINATSNTTTLTISSAVAGAATDAQGITFNNPVGTLTGESTVEGALNFLANQFLFKQLPLHQVHRLGRRGFILRY